MNIFIVMDVLAVVYVIVGVVIGVMAYVAPISASFQEKTEEWAEMINATPAEINTLASVIIAIIWPCVVFNALRNKKAHK